MSYAQFNFIDTDILACKKEKKIQFKSLTQYMQWNKNESQELRNLFKGEKNHILN